MKNIKIEYLDHVAIRVKSLDKSAKWYEDVLGFSKAHLKEWGSYPIFMLSGKYGVALFPADESLPSLDPNSKHVKIDHFAFNVNRENFEAAKDRFDALNVNYVIQNHHYFESIYINDPDGHCVEFTTILVDEDEFYK